jgi:hypothetical protein
VDDIKKTKFPSDPGPNFKSEAKAKDKDGKADVTLTCPPPDLPPGV